MRLVMTLGLALLAGCSLVPNGISRETAIAAAAQSAREDMADPVFVEATRGRLADLAPPGVVYGSVEEMQREVWAVTFGGEVEECLPMPDLAPDCMRRPGTKVVYVDIETGLVTASSTSVRVPP